MGATGIKFYDLMGIADISMWGLEINMIALSFCIQHWAIIALSWVISPLLFLLAFSSVSRAIGRSYPGAPENLITMLNGVALLVGATISILALVTVLGFGERFACPVREPDPLFSKRLDIPSEYLFTD